MVAGQVATVGRSPNNRIVVEDEISSRNHCEIFRVGDRWILRDLESRNGTRVDGEYVTARLRIEFRTDDSDWLHAVVVHAGSECSVAAGVARLPMGTRPRIWPSFSMTPEIVHRARTSKYPGG